MGGVGLPKVTFIYKKIFKKDKMGLFDRKPPQNIPTLENILIEMSEIKIKQKELAAQQEHLDQLFRSLRGLVNKRLYPEPETDTKSQETPKDLNIGFPFPRV